MIITLAQPLQYFLSLCACIVCESVRHSLPYQHRCAQILRVKFGEHRFYDFLRFPYPFPAYVFVVLVYLQRLPFRPAYTILVLAALKPYLNATLILRVIILYVFCSAYSLPRQHPCHGFRQTRFTASVRHVAIRIVNVGIIPSCYAYETLTAQINLCFADCHKILDFYLIEPHPTPLPLSPCSRTFP